MTDANTDSEQSPAEAPSQTAFARAVPLGAAASVVLVVVAAFAGISWCSTAKSEPL